MNIKRYENTRRIVYEGGATFVPVCAICGRYVRPDDNIEINEMTGVKKQPNATCSKCGRIEMLFELFV